MSKVPDNIVKTWQEEFDYQLSIPINDRNWNIIIDCITNLDTCDFNMYSNILLQVVKSNTLSDGIIKNLILAIIHNIYSNVDGETFNSHMVRLLYYNDYNEFVCCTIMEYIQENNLVLRMTDWDRCGSYSVLHNLDKFEKYIPISIIDFSNVDFVHLLCQRVNNSAYLMYFFDTYSDIFNLKSLKFSPNQKSCIEAWVTLSNRGYDVDLSGYGYKAVYHMNLLDELDNMKNKINELENKIKELTINNNYND